MTPEAYDALERFALTRLGNRQIEASGCLAFDHTGYPHRVHDERELWRYADVMQEGRARATMDLLGGLTEEEFELVTSMVHWVRAQTNRWHQAVTPTAALLRAILVVRQVVAINLPHLVSLELGPGSGYVSGLLGLRGFQVNLVEVSQAFALWQRRLIPTATHIPWWEWVQGKGPERAGIVTANHCLNELHANALGYFVHRAAAMLGDTGLFVAEDPGAAYLRPAQETMKAFRGWSAVARGPVAILAPPGSKVDVMRLPELKGDRTRGWHDLLALWGGEPESVDERFLQECAP